MANDDWNLFPVENSDQSGWNDINVNASVASAERANNINSGFQPEARGVQQLKGPFYWPLTIIALLTVGALSFLMAYLTKDTAERSPLLMGLIFAVPMAAMFLSALVLERRTCAMTPSYLRKAQTIIAASAVVATMLVGVFCDWIYLHSFVMPERQNTVFVLDKSGSMSGENNQQMIRAMDQVLADMPTWEEVGLVLFDDEVRDSVAIASLKENQRNMLMDRIRRTGASGMTDFNLPLLKALELISDHANGLDTQIIFLTDGGAWLTPEQINAFKTKCQTYQVTIHGVAFTQSGELSSMQSLIDATGGKTVRANDMKELIQVMGVLTIHDDDMLRSQAPKANLMTGIMLGMEGAVIGLGLWLMLSVRGQFRVQTILSPIMGMVGLLLLKGMGVDASHEYWWLVEGSAFTLLGVVFMRKNRLLEDVELQPDNQRKEEQSKQLTVQIPDFD